MASLIPSAAGTGTGSCTLQGPATNSNQVVTLPDATGTVVVSGQNSAITAGTAQASTSGTSIDFTGIPSWVKRITVMFNGVSTSGTSNPQVQIGAGSVTTSGYISVSTNLQNGSSVGNTNSSAGFIVYQNVASEATYGALTITLVGSNIWVASGNFACNTGITFFSNSAGGVTLSGTLDRVRITTVNGTDTFDAGSINILYE